MQRSQVRGLQIPLSLTGWALTCYFEKWSFLSRGSGLENSRKDNFTADLASQNN